MSDELLRWDFRVTTGSEQTRSRHSRLAPSTFSSIMAGALRMNRKNLENVQSGSGYTSSCINIQSLPDDFGTCWASIRHHWWGGPPGLQSSRNRDIQLIQGPLSR